MFDLNILVHSIPLYFKCIRAFPMKYYFLVLLLKFGTKQKTYHNAMLFCMSNLTYTIFGTKFGTKYSQILA